ncbi:FtsX-like permease family protein [Actinomadura parmotrematis]|uniref:ABC transporter permease n=1 Tax=Actinomadura parmotrematis TaxID=2864039 RepID=A0ABS7FQZ1_9ACTN|nr:FtsX-like permease family protein [Actinomadura parmotrematis]MBW8482824.1 ABC transporter permease [Actinomadura parmotrematis]
MFLVLRELRAARARFLLMGAVVALIAALVGIVSGFTNGLGDDTVSALRRLPATHIAFAAGTGTDAFARSALDPAAVRGWQAVPGVEATPVGVAIARGTTGRGVPVDLAAFGVEPGSFAAPAGLTAGGVVVSRKIADAGVRPGDTLAVDRTGVRLPVVGVTGRSAYGHVPAAYMSLATWRRVHPAARPGEVSAVALRARAGADLAAADRRLGTRTETRDAAFAAAPGYTGERLTMNSILVFLYLIAPLVVGAFFAVWTVQRTPELALLRALGAARRTLLGHTLAQAALVVVAASLAGGALAAGAGLALGAAVPFSLPAASLLGTVAAVSAAGLAGAALTLRRVASPDPLTMLGAAR